MAAILKVTPEQVEHALNSGTLVINNGIKGQHIIELDYENLVDEVALCI